MINKKTRGSLKSLTGFFNFSILRTMKAVIFLIHIELTVTMMHDFLVIIVFSWYPK